MSSEISFAGNLTITPPGSPTCEEDIGFVANMAGNGLVRNKLQVGTSAQALPLGSVSSLGVCLFHNLDPTNYIDIIAGPSPFGQVLMRLLPGEKWPARLHPSVVPWAQAHTAACWLDYVIAQA